MPLAGRLLTTGDAPLRSIAQRTGYATEFSSVKAFKHEYATSPGRFRRAHTGDSGP